MSTAPEQVDEYVNDKGQRVVVQYDDEPLVSPTYAFDVEVFPNFVSVVFISVDDETDRHEFYIHPELKDVGQRYKNLWQFLQQDMTLVGFNSIGYDEFILKALLNKWNRYKIYRLSLDIVEGNERDDIRDLRYQEVPWKRLDLQKVLGTFSSLKQIAVNMQWHKIQDLPLPFDADIALDQIPMVMRYNVNDVEITRALYWAIKEEIDLRAGISEEYGVDVHSESRSGVANRLLEKMYADETRIPKVEFRHGRTERTKLFGGDCIAPNISFQTYTLQSLVTEISGTNVITEKLKTHVEVGGVIFDIGVGGLHSRDDPGVFTSNDDYEIVDADVASFYPMIMLLNKFGPEHLGDNFLKVFQKMTEDRLAAKKAGEKLRADALKITINSIFGKMNFENYWLYDPKSFYSVTISGQLYLLMLVERFVEGGIQVLSGNTDGVVCCVHKDQKSTYEAVCQQWQVDTGFELEFTPYAKFIRKDVNNYIVIKPDDSVKVKGSLSPDIPLTGGYKYPIVKRAIHDHFVYGKFTDETLKEADNILDFCLSQRVSKNKFTDVVSVNHQTGERTELQWTNRYFASKSGDELRKTSVKTGRTTCLLAGQGGTVINDVDPHRPISDYDIDYQYYQTEINKVVELIAPSVVQLSLI